MLDNSTRQIVLSKGFVAIVGVFWSPKDKAWRVGINIGGQVIAKQFKDKQEAINYREKLDIEYFKEHSHLNR